MPGSQPGQTQRRTDFTRPDPSVIPVPIWPELAELADALRLPSGDG
jgi:hypothetical protein